MGYPSTMAEELGLHALVRTGIEEDGALRLSGLDAHPGVVCLATTALYPDFGPERFDDALATARRAFMPALGAGYESAFVARLIPEIEAADLARPVRLVIPVAAPPQEITRMLERMQAEGLADRAAVGVEYSVSPSEEARRYGPPWATRREILLVAPAARAAEERAARPTVFLATGQRGPAFVLPAAPSIRHANVFAAPASPAGVVQALRASLRFAEAHPALLGSERVASVAPSGPEEARFPAESVERLLRSGAPSTSPLGEPGLLPSAGDPRAAMAAAVVTRMLQRAGASGLRPSRRELLPAFVNYQMTAVIMCYRIAREDDPRGERWIEVGMHAASVMSSVALSDEEVFDRPTPELSVAERRQWLESVARYLGTVVHGGVVAEAPPGPARAEVEAIALLWRETRERYGSRAHPTVLAGWCRAMAGLYTSNVDEIDPDVARDPLLVHLRMVGQPRRAAAASIEARHASAAPAPVAARMRRLLEALVSEPQRVKAVVAELTLWVFLGHTAPSIAAGVLFRHVALLWPSALVTEPMAQALDRVATLIDYRFRLANDLSDLRGAAGLDRDDKPNAWTVLVAENAAGVEAASATIEAIALCREAEALIQRELERELAELDRVWPTLARFVHRGIRVGALVYRSGHFATASWSFMLEVFREIEAPAEAGQPESRANPPGQANPKQANPRQANPKQSSPKRRDRRALLTQPFQSDTPWLAKGGS